MCYQDWARMCAVLPYPGTRMTVLCYHLPYQIGTRTMSISLCWTAPDDEWVGIPQWIAWNSPSEVILSLPCYIPIPWSPIQVAFLPALIPSHQSIFNLQSCAWKEDRTVTSEWNDALTSGNWTRAISYRRFTRVTGWRDFGIHCGFFHSSFFLSIGPEL